MSLITEQDVRHVAKLSRLKLSDEQASHFAQQLSRVLEYVSKLQELDLSGVEPMAHPTDLTDCLREDVVGERLSVEQALSNAPQKDPPYFRVPKVLDEGAQA